MGGVSSRVSGMVRKPASAAHMTCMAKISTPKDLRNLVKLAESQGWEFDRTNSGHVKFCSPYRETPPVFYSGTPGDRRAHSNLLAKLRRAGLDIPRSFAS
ncbi:hypothetical protein Achl_4346 (plasmid) [Pseudarthrobacter chlorophenolicus A6]|uniref:YcfA family protein n=2 Tax=Pseudarthrobacter chlorophenolicus TaxID=85085 RepID=B8HIQ0_PSECP|nr:hypothetical protein Achl_4346 [Pseudarthrobacter chlorophenolicus A6]SDQ16156.1 hypothetical protein SAMN04489738_0403 [Pseudarthrobacter chlorophenolicus]